jgi:hypothetical protein
LTRLHSPMTVDGRDTEPVVTEDTRELAAD